LIYRLADGISVKTTPEGGLLVASRPLRMLRLNQSLLELTRRLEQDWLSPQTAAESSVLETLAKRGFVQYKRVPLQGDRQFPAVSVVIPVKDRADELRACLTSLQQLDYPRQQLEIVVVDDGSSDHTPAVAREMGALLVASGAVAGGPALARNRGAQAASGEILAFIDSDCIASPQWLMELLPVFAKSKVAAVGGLVEGM